ncbi:MAG: SEFIR domain-containing protein, partial [Rhabdochlamydiaceae bacterium]
MSSPPRLFISYSWSTPEHEQWVVDLATELTNSGVDVTLDKWDLREGHDAVAFMETMVTDPSISKVIIVCDQLYASKADGRSGGVGTETQIISAGVYAKRDQDKFVAVIAEKDAEGKPYLPTYYKSRIYVDLSESERYAENFEKLLRWLFDKPLYTKPEIGNPPTFIVEPESPTLGTSVLAKRVIEGARNDKGYTRGALDEYLSIFSTQLERFRITFNDDEPDEKIVESIESFIPARDEFV